MTSVSKLKSVKLWVDEPSSATVSELSIIQETIDIISTPAIKFKSHQNCTYHPPLQWCHHWASVRLDEFHAQGSKAP